jgi:hypothetical protein
VLAFFIPFVDCTQKSSPKATCENLIHSSCMVIFIDLFDAGSLRKNIAPV